MTNKLSEFINQYPIVETLGMVVLLLLIATLANLLIKRVLLRIVARLSHKIPFCQNRDLHVQTAIKRLANIVPAVVISLGIALVPHMPGTIVTVVINVAHAFVILMLAMAIAATLDIAEAVYRHRPRAALKPIKGYVQIVKIALYIIAAILIIATLIDRSPFILLSGLGAMAAVLILVFQDTLLSLVAGIQISSTDMVRVGDWIEMPTLNADGNVMEISLYTVQVQNWDMTISNIPIRKLVTESFKNWRGMTESGGRRIKRSINLDQTSIRFLTPEEIGNLHHFRYLDFYLAHKEKELQEWNDKLTEKSRTQENMRRLTNVGTFRAYVEAYLHNHPKIHQKMTRLVRHLQPGREGLPLELYCFTNITDWNEYESIQADIFDHLFALLPEFGLRIFQDPTGGDFKLLTREE